MRKILFVAEGSTLAHVVRPLTLASALDPASWDITLARPVRYADLLARLPRHIRQIDLVACAPEQFDARLARGAPLYTLSELRAYSEHDAVLLRECAPDFVVGDFRISLGVSARLAGIPYVSLSNAYWSPGFRRPAIVPALPFAKALPLPVATALFAMVSPIAFKLHAHAMESLRREHGMAGLAHDLNRVYTDADLTLYCDAPEFCADIAFAANERAIGHVPWSPDVALPDWWHALPDSAPLVYVNLGSSGDTRNRAAIIDGVLARGATVLLATAGRGEEPVPRPGRLFTTRFIPGDLAARRAAAVVCNGGSPSTYQALNEGAPVLGIASNLDQHLNMYLVARAGLGLKVRSDRCTARTIEAALSALLDDGEIRRRATAYAAQPRIAASTLFVAALEDLI